jgi:hypothetical protein
MKTSNWSTRHYFNRLADAERGATASERHLAAIEAMLAAGEADDDILAALSRRRSLRMRLSSNDAVSSSR